MTQFTSFVAVEERIVNQDGKQVRIEVPVDAPAGTVYSAATAEINSTGSVAGSNVSTGFFSNIPTARSVQGLYTVTPTVARSGLTRRIRQGPQPVGGRFVGAGE